MNGTAVYGERVVVVEVESGNVLLKTGRISSTDSSHVHADNRSKTVVRGDRKFQRIEGSPEDAFEKAFRVTDIHLLKEQEVAALQKDPDSAQNWFGTVYHDWLVTKIHRALKRLKLN